MVKVAEESTAKQTRLAEILEQKQIQAAKRYEAAAKAVEAAKLQAAKVSAEGSGNAAQKAAAAVIKAKEKERDAAAKTLEFAILRRQDAVKAAERSSTDAAQAVERGADREKRAHQEANSAIVAATRKAVAERAKAFAEGADRLGSSLTTRLTLPVVGLAGFGVKAAADVENARNMLTSVMGDTMKATAEMAKLNDVARLPGLGQIEGYKASAQLQAVGFSADKAREAVKQFANLNARGGGDASNFGEIVRQFTQIQSLGKVTAENLNVILERAPEFAKVLKNAFGTANGEILQKAIENGKLSFDDFVNGVVSSMGRLKRAQSTTTDDWQNFLDDVKLASAKLGQEIVPELRKMAPEVTKSFGEIIKVGIPIARQVMPEVAGAVKTVAGAFNSLSPQAKEALAKFVVLGAVGGPTLKAASALFKVGDGVVSILSGAGKFLKWADTTAKAWAGVEVAANAAGLAQARAGGGTVAGGLGQVAKAVPYVAAVYAGYEFSKWQAETEDKDRARELNAIKTAYLKGGRKAALAEALKSSGVNLFGNADRHAEYDVNLVEQKIAADRRKATQSAADAGELRRFAIDGRYRAKLAREAAEKAQKARPPQSAASSFSGAIDLSGYDPKAEAAAAKEAKRRAKAAEKARLKALKPRTSRAGGGRYTSTYGGSQPNAVAAGHDIERMFGVHDIGGFATKGHKPNSDHYTGRALDVMIGKNKLLGNAVATWAIKNAEQMGVQYVIWNNRINTLNGKGWRPYVDSKGRRYGTPTLRHEDHPHLSFAPGKQGGRNGGMGTAGWEFMGGMANALKGSGKGLPASLKYDPAFTAALAAEKDAAERRSKIADGFDKLRQSMAAATDGRAKYAEALGMSLREYKALSPEEQKAAQRLVALTERQEAATKARAAHKDAMASLDRERAKAESGGKEDARDTLSYERFGKSFKQVQANAAKEAGEAAKVVETASKRASEGMETQRALTMGTTAALGLYGVATVKAAEDADAQRAMILATTAALGLYGVAMGEAAKVSADGPFARAAKGAGAVPGISAKARPVAKLTGAALDASEIEGEVRAREEIERTNAEREKRIAAMKGFWTRVVDAAKAEKERRGAIKGVTDSLDDQLLKQREATTVEKTFQDLKQKGVRITVAETFAILGKAGAVDKEIAADKARAAAEKQGQARREADGRFKDAMFDAQKRIGGKDTTKALASRRFAELTQQFSAVPPLTGGSLANVAKSAADQVAALAAGAEKAKRYLSFEREVEGVERLRGAFEEAAKSMEGGFRASMGNLLRGDLPGFFGSLTGMVDDAARSIANSFLQAQIGRGIAGLTNSLVGGLAGGGKGVGLTGALQSFAGTKNGGELFAVPGFAGGMLSLPGRERGGPVLAGRPYLVGERRPEVFVPERNGSIHPDASRYGSGSGGGDTIIINMTVHANDAASFQRMSPDQLFGDAYDRMVAAKRRNG